MHCLRVWPGGSDSAPFLHRPITTPNQPPHLTALGGDDGGAVGRAVLPGIAGRQQVCSVEHLAPLPATLNQQDAQAAGGGSELLRRPRRCRLLLQADPVLHPAPRRHWPLPPLHLLRRQRRLRVVRHRCLAKGIGLKGDLLAQPLSHLLRRHGGLLLRQRPPGLREVAATEERVREAALLAALVAGGLLLGVQLHSGRAGATLA